MNNQDLIALLEIAAESSRGTKVERLKKKPGRIFFSLMLETLCLLTKRTFTTKAKTFWGQDLTVVFPEFVSLFLFRYGFFEEGLTRMILEYLKPGMSFFDIGAHYGYYSMLGSFLVGAQGTVHAFEPTQSTYRILTANTSNRDNVTVNNRAVSSQQNKLSINDYGIRYSSHNSMFRARLPQAKASKLKSKRYEVEACSIDEYVYSRTLKPDFIKIDAESFEYEILLGMERTIAEFHPMISIEVGDVEGLDVPPSKKIINFITDRGYRVWAYQNGKIAPHQVQDRYVFDNILFLPNP